MRKTIKSCKNKTTTALKQKDKMINMTKQIKLLLLFMIISNTAAFANGITVSNISISGQNTVEHYSLVNFDISWDNSWRINASPANWDAAWIFVKYRPQNQTTWKHATLHWVDGTGTADGHTVPANATIASSNDNGSGGAHGVFVYHDSAMPQGSVNYTGAKLRWDYGADGLPDGDLVEVCVFAIEMVYVPQGSFELGSGGTEANHFYKYPITTNTYTVNSENAITVGTTAGNLYYNAASGVAGDRSGPIPAAFPKGYHAFYCMKYEISQDQYTAFLNKLTGTQDANRFPNRDGISRHAIAGSSGNRTTTRPYVACNYLSWGDLAAYLDWAALRPMTELEYEKACRGTKSPVPNEYAWGTTNIAGNAYTISNAEAANEDIATNYSTSAGNANYNTTNDNIGGPLRCGIFAGNAGNTGRETSGATYYGIMEMTGNLSERTVTVGDNSGRAFTGTNGDGMLATNGDANTVNWPGASAIGVGSRGGAALLSIFPLERLHSSSRILAASPSTARSNSSGGRGCRTAP